MSTKKSVNDARRREVLARKRAAQRAQRHEQALIQTASSGLRRILRLPEVEAMTARGRTAILADIDNGLFPKPMRLGPRRVGWLAAEVEAWIEAKAAERHQHEAA
jgi:prophage regulatory protein